VTDPSPAGGTVATMSNAVTSLDLAGLSPTTLADLLSAAATALRAHAAPPAPPALPEPKYLGVTAYAKRCGVSATTVRQWIADGMPSTRSTGRTRIIVADADRWHEQGPGGKPALRAVPGGRR
jgi:hypothetical protein